MTKSLVRAAEIQIGFELHRIKFPLSITFNLLELIQLLLEDLRVQIAAFEQKLVEVRASL